MGALRWGSGPQLLSGLQTLPDLLQALPHPPGRRGLWVVSRAGSSGELGGWPWPCDVTGGGVGVRETPALASQSFPSFIFLGL